MNFSKKEEECRLSSKELADDYMKKKGYTPKGALYIKDGIPYSCNKRGEIERYYTVEDKQKLKMNNWKEPEDLNELYACLKCGEKKCKCTLDDVKNHMINYAKTRIKKMSKYTDAGMRARNVMIAQEIGFVQDGNKPETFIMFDEVSGMQVKAVIDFRKNRKSPNPINGVRWAYVPSEKRFLSDEELDEVSCLKAYKDMRDDEDYLPENHPLKEVGGKWTLRESSEESIDDFPMPSEKKINQSKGVAQEPIVGTSKTLPENLTESKPISKESKQLVPIAQQNQGIVELAVTPKQFLESWNNYTEFRDSIQTEDDVQEIQGKSYLKKSYWRKVATAFNLSDEVVDEIREGVQGGFIWRIKVRCIAPNGRSTIGVGVCDSRERNFAHIEHDVYSTAHTRAKNRSISDLVGGGSVSAEEMK